MHDLKSETGASHEWPQNILCPTNTFKNNARTTKLYTILNSDVLTKSIFFDMFELIYVLANDSDTDLILICQILPNCK